LRAKARLRCTDILAGAGEITMPKILCVLNGGMGDQILALPAIRYLLSVFSGQELEIRMGGWKLRATLLRTLLGLPISIRSLDALRYKSPRLRHSIQYDWVLDFDFRDPPATEALASWVIPRQGYFSFPKRNPRKNQTTFLLRNENGSEFWQLCFSMAFRLACMIQHQEFSSKMLKSICQKYRTFPLKTPSLKIQKRIQSFLSTAGNAPPRLAITPGGYNPKHKLWPAERFVEVICYLVSRNVNVFVLGSKSESPLSWKIFEMIRHKPESWKRNAPGNLSFLTGKVTLQELPYLLQEMDLHLSNDNGVAQIAGAINMPQIVLHRGSDSSHRSLGRKDILIFSGDNFDMKPISTESVIRCLDQQLEKKNR
jgi:ADP-heptose:LPS heptosyltransferase